MTVTSFVQRHRYLLIDYAVLLLAIAVCVPVLVVVPDARAYAATILAWTLAFATHPWRWLPWEQRRLRQRAHRRADRVMQQRGVGPLHRRAAAALNTSTASTATATVWSCATLPHRSDGNRLPWGAVGEESGEWPLKHQPLQRKFLQDSGDSSGSQRRLPPITQRATIREAVARPGGASMAARAAPMADAGHVPSVLRFSSSALESSSQFLALSTSASPTRQSPSPAQEPPSVLRRSHEPFTYLSRQSSLSLDDATALSSPCVSAIDVAAAGGEGERSAVDSPVAFPSLSPASSCRTHGYVPPSTHASPAPSTRHHRGDSVSSSRSSSSSPAAAPSVPPPARILVLASTVQRPAAAPLATRGVPTPQ